MKSQRLLAIAEFIEKGDRVFDIGADHGLLSIYLSQTNNVVATDISKNSVIKLKQKIKELDISGIEVIHTDGLLNLDIKKKDIIILSGIGTNVILKILKTSIGKLPNRLIISSHKNQYQLRKNIVKLGYIIKDEKVIYENNHYYVIHYFEKGKTRYTFKDYYIGIKTDVNYLKHLHNIYNIAYHKIPIKHLLKRIKTKFIINTIKKELDKF